MKRSLVLGLVLVLVCAGAAFGSQQGLRNMLDMMVDDADSMARRGDVGKDAANTFTVIAGVFIRTGIDKGTITKAEGERLACVAAGLATWISYGGLTALLPNTLELIQKCIKTR